MMLPSSFRVASRAAAPRSMAAAFSTSAVKAMATPATERAPKMKAFKIYRWVCVESVQTCLTFAGPREP